MLEMIMHSGKEKELVLTCRPVTPTGDTFVPFNTFCPFGVYANELHYLSDKVYFKLNLGSMVWVKETSSIPGISGGSARVEFDTAGKTSLIWGRTSEGTAGVDTYTWTLPGTNNNTKTATAPVSAYTTCVVDAGEALYYYGAESVSRYPNGITGLIKYSKVTNTFTTLNPTGMVNPPASGELLRPSGTYYNGEIYFLFGKTKQLKNWKYNIAANTWLPVADSPALVTFTCDAVVFKNKFYLFGGELGGVRSNMLYCYDPVKDVWSSLGSFGITPRRWGSMFATDNHFYLLGGWDANQGNRTDLYEFTLS